LRSAVALSVVLLAASAAGCGNRTDDYCATLKDDGPRLERLADAATKPDAGVLGESLEVLEGLQDEAPDDIADEWDTLVIAWRQVTQAYRSAGDRVSSSEQAGIRQAAERLRSTAVQQAAAGIEQHALDVCQVDLGGSL
jgi:hypothetical protein